MVCQKTSEQWFDEKGWHFNENNDFVDKHDQLFDFETQQEHYEYVHLRIKNMIYKELKQRFGFMQYPVPARPVKSRRDLVRCRKDAYCPQVFMTPDVMVNLNLLVIVQGLGEVPPGQWARKLLTSGKKGQWNYATQFPFIERARHLGWAVLLCDPNHDEGVPRTQRTRTHHVCRVWDDIVSRSEARCVMYVGFSAGTRSTLELFCSKKREFMKRVKAIALLDGDSGTGLHHMEGGRWLKEHSWSFSQRRLGMKPPPNGEFVATSDHDTAPGMAVNEIFEFLQESLHWYEAKLPQDEYDKGKSYYETITATTATTATTTIATTN